MNSLDPRINRLELKELSSFPYKTDKMDQFQTYQVFVKSKENKPFEHLGIVHAPNLEMAFLFAKEQFSRRLSCVGLSLIKTRDIISTPYTEDKKNVYDFISVQGEEPFPNPERYEIFHLYKRGKQHQHALGLEAKHYQDAIIKAKSLYDHKRPVLNIWIAKRSHIMYSLEEEKDIWSTLSDKKYREVISYRAQDKIIEFKSRPHSGHK